MKMGFIQVNDSLTNNIIIDFFLLLFTNYSKNHNVAF